MRRLARLVGMTGIAIGWIAVMPGVAIAGIAALLLDWGESDPDTGTDDHLADDVRALLHSTPVTEGTQRNHGA